MRAKKIFIALGLTAAAFAASPALAIPAFGVDLAGQLVTFDTLTPGTITSSRQITGLAGTTIRGIDVRPATGELYALTGNTLYTLNTSTGVATVASTIFSSLMGTNFDIDFNPTVDRLRIVSDAGQNLRVNVNTGSTTVDGTLAYAAGDPNAASTPSIVGAGYTNSVAGTVATTTLYGIDASNNTLVTIAPPNAGSLNTIGGLGIGETASDRRGIGFDISSDNQAFLSLGTGFFQVSLTSGKATRLGTTAGLLDFTVGTAVPDAAPPIPSAVPEPASWAMMIGGMGMAGGAMRRRKSKVKTSVKFA